MACGKKNNFCSNKLFYTNPFAASAAIQNEEEMIIASGTFNLKDIAANVLTWASGCTAANTAPTHAVVTMAAADTYADDATAFELELDSIMIGDLASQGIKTKIETLGNTKTLVFYINGNFTDSLYSNTGNWALPVTQGTLNDFRVKVYILGTPLS